MDDETRGRQTFAEQEGAKSSTVKRRPTKMHAIVNCRGRFQSAIVRNISPGGMKLENVQGLMPGDVVSIELLSLRVLGGTVVWSVGSFCGIKFARPLADDDPLFEVA